MDIKNYISAPDAAEIMGKDFSYIRNLCRQGKLPGAIKIGRNWLIPRESAENYTPGPKGFAARPKAPTILPEWEDILSPRPPKKNGS